MQSEIQCTQCALKSDGEQKSSVRIKHLLITLCNKPFGEMFQMSMKFTSGF